MKLDFSRVLIDAWRLFRRDADLLLRIAGPFLFLPAFALALFVPPWPAPDAAIADPEAKAQAWMDALSVWFSANGTVSVIAYVVMYFGIALLLTMYLDSGRPDVRGGLVRTLRLFPRFLLATVLVSLPTGLGLMLVIPGLYLLGRMMLVAPALIADDRLSATAAVGRGWRLTRGHGLSLMALAAFVYLAGVLVATPLAALDGWLRAGEAGGNPVAFAIVDAGSAAVATATAIATTLIAVVAYRRLAR